MDDLLLKYRNELYNRDNTFIIMLDKHINNKCNCKKNNKICNYNTVILKDFKNKWITLKEKEKEIYYLENKETFETLFNLNLSITNSMKSKAGKDFENCIEKILKENGFIEKKHYGKQMFIDNEGKIFLNKKSKKGHILDFLIPYPQDEMLLKDFIEKENGLHISVKTTTRERVNQDKFTGKFTLITLDDYKTDDKNIDVLSIKKGGNSFDILIKKLKNKLTIK